MGTIVVGIDGSATAWEALTWSAREASLRNAKLKIVNAWRLPSGANYFIAPAAALEVASNELLEDAAERVRHLLGPADEIEVVTMPANLAIAPALIEQSEGADLLVVGSRGHGAFIGMLLGSVSLHCATHARCPVVIVHPEAEGAAGERTTTAR